MDEWCGELRRWTEWTGMFETLLATFGPLIGVVVGIVFTSRHDRSVQRETQQHERKLERERWQHERTEKFLGVKREAICATLEWTRILTNTKSILRGGLNHMSPDKWLDEYESGLKTIHDGLESPEHRAVLSDDVYAKRREIMGHLLECGEIGHKINSGVLESGVSECKEVLDRIGEQISELERELQGEYRRAFGVDVVEEGGDMNEGSHG